MKLCAPQVLDKQRKRGRGVRRSDRLLPTLSFVFILLTLPNLADLVIQVLEQLGWDSFTAAPVSDPALPNPPGVARGACPVHLPPPPAPPPAHPDHRP